MMKDDHGSLNSQLQLWSEDDVRLVLGSCLLKPDDGSGSTESMSMQICLI